MISVMFIMIMIMIVMIIRSNCDDDYENGFKVDTHPKMLKTATLLKIDSTSYE